MREFITAGKANQTVPARSVFAPAFVDAIGRGLADLDKDGYVTGTELGLYLQRVGAAVCAAEPAVRQDTGLRCRCGDFVFRGGCAAAIPGKAPEAAQPRGTASSRGAPLQPAKLRAAAFGDLAEADGSGMRS